mmetsp:Transcript_18011/g.37230  ORF Transcript_18011/g.37230 Transcript_18011/m.37230 type:complete len:84 (-) Transcript_18011:243-494(-)
MVRFQSTGFLVSQLDFLCGHDKGRKPTWLRVLLVTLMQKQRNRNRSSELHAGGTAERHTAREKLLATKFGIQRWHYRPFWYSE